MDSIWATALWESFFTAIKRINKLGNPVDLWSQKLAGINLLDQTVTWSWISMKTEWIDSIEFRLLIAKLLNKEVSWIVNYPILVSKSKCNF